jgi:hypothetical protein
MTSPSSKHVAFYTHKIRFFGRYTFCILNAFEIAAIVLETEGARTAQSE